MDIQPVVGREYLCSVTVEPGIYRVDGGGEHGLETYVLHTGPIAFKRLLERWDPTATPKEDERGGSWVVVYRLDGPSNLAPVFLSQSPACFVEFDDVEVVDLDADEIPNRGSLGGVFKPGPR